MKLLNNKEDKFPTGYLLYQNEAPRTGNGLYRIEVLTKRIPLKFPNHLGYC